MLQGYNVAAAQNRAVARVPLGEGQKLPAEKSAAMDCGRASVQLGSPYRRVRCPRALWRAIRLLPGYIQGHAIVRKTHVVAVQHGVANVPNLVLWVNRESMLVCVGEANDEVGLLYLRDLVTDAQIVPGVNVTQVDLRGTDRTDRHIWRVGSTKGTHR